MKIFNGLEPEGIWKYFEEICKIPRPSGKEEKIIGFIEEFAQTRGLELIKDNAADQNHWGNASENNR